MRAAAATTLCALAVGLFAGCGLSHTRYACQEQRSWHLARCNPPECVPHGDCTEYLVPAPDER